MPSVYQGQPEEVLALNLYIKLSRAYEAVNNRLMKQGTLQGLTISQFGVLEALFHRGSMCQHDLSIKILRSPANLTTVIDNLEKLSLVQRTACETDRRRLIIKLTEAGEQLIKTVLPLHVAAIVKEFSVLTPTEQEQFAQLAKKLGLANS